MGQARAAQNFVLVALPAGLASGWIFMNVSDLACGQVLTLGATSASIAQHLRS